MSHPSETADLVTWSIVALMFLVYGYIVLASWMWAHALMWFLELLPYLRALQIDA